MPLPRRSHRKARTGCLNCKKRRIKCDEDKPSCKNCSQHRVKCGYATSQATEAQRAASHVEPALSPQLGDNQNITESSQPSPYSNLHIPSSPSTHNDVTDLKLMHYFTTSTYQTLSDRREIQFLWQVQVPELAFDHRFLLSIILSVAALDIDRKRAACSTIFAPYARHQYELSLQSSTHALTNVTPSNCHALYLFSALAFLFEIATSYGNKSLLYQGDTTLAPWILHARGVRTIIGSSYHHLVSGILKPMFECKFLEEGPTNIVLSLDFVVKHLRSAYPAQTLPVYLDAISELTKWSKVVHHGFSGWISQFSDEYGSLLAGKDPFALIIFAHACVLLKYGEPRSWIDRWPEAMVEEVHVLLEPSFRGWLRWPMKELAMRFRESPSTQLL